MTDAIWKRDEPESPCVKICVLDPEAGLCLGCLRSADEIARWRDMPAEERRAILEALPARAPLLKKGRRGGRRGRLAARGLAGGEGSGKGSGKGGH